MHFPIVEVVTKDDLPHLIIGADTVRMQTPGCNLQESLHVGRSNSRMNIPMWKKGSDELRLVLQNGCSLKLKLVDLCAGGQPLWCNNMFINKMIRDDWWVNVENEVVASSKWHLLIAMEKTIQNL